MKFEMNGVVWTVKYVKPFDALLTRSDGSKTVGMTDKDKLTVYISESLYGEFKRKVICHELTHAAMFSYGINLDLYQEELVADLISSYGDEIIYNTNKIFNVLKYVS